jgi:hypothetical protein
VHATACINNERHENLYGSWASRIITSYLYYSISRILYTLLSDSSPTINLQSDKIPEFNICLYWSTIVPRRQSLILADIVVLVLWTKRFLFHVKNRVCFYAVQPVQL